MNATQAWWTAQQQDRQRHSWMETVELSSIYQEVASENNRN